LLLVLLRILNRNGGQALVTSETNTPPRAPAAAPSTESRDRLLSRLPHRRSASEPAPTAEQIVASKVRQFARNRRALAHALAERFKIEVPADVERFFAAVESGNWDEIDAAFKPIGERYKAKPPPRDIDVLWGPILEALGVAESAHDWPAERLLDYGDAVLGSLRPGMVYVGGTDPGRFIPTLLNETSDGERHVIITQNGLAASSYVDYLNFLYGDRLATLTHEDSNRAFQDYYSDLQRRLAHDQEFPNEPKQVLPGENSPSSDAPRSITSKDGLVEISGSTAMMAVNERLLQMILQKNPELSFALEESFPLKSTYSDATLLGPITEIRAQDPQNALTAERAAQSIEYWRSVAEQFRINPDESEESVAFKTYSKLAVAQANLFADRNFTTEAEQAYRTANQIYPANVEAATGLAGVFMRSGRTAEANQMLDQFTRDYPNQRRAVEDFRRTFASATGQPPSGQR
jgi:tetratricopeptide (TPR) repeat protein